MDLNQCSGYQRPSVYYNEDHLIDIGSLAIYESIITSCNSFHIHTYMYIYDLEADCKVSIPVGLTDLSVLMSDTQRQHRMDIYN